MPQTRPQPRRPRALAALCAVIALTAGLSACDIPGVGSGEATTEIVQTHPGGVLTTMALGPVETWDPQRISARTDAAFAGRVFARTLTAYQHGSDDQSQVTLTGDLAVDTGAADRTLRVWTFTIRDGVKWQDGSPLTCADVKYGISRSFATETITGGPNYAYAYLDVPKSPEGESIYRGPYAEGAEADAGQRAFDRAVSCDGAELTIRLSEEVADFPGMVSTLGFSAYKESEDRGAASRYAVFSAGPYTLAAPWNPDRGGTFVRNPHWTSASDPVRLALPDEIVYREGMEPQLVAQRIMADDTGSEAAVALDTAPPVIQDQIAAAAAVRERAVNPVNGIVDYLVPNFRSPVMADAQVRAAFALATDRSVYLEALGGPTAAEPSISILSHGLRAALPEPVEDVVPTGTVSPEDPGTTGVPSGETTAQAPSAGATEDAAAPTSQDPATPGTSTEGATNATSGTDNGADGSTDAATDPTDTPDAAAERAAALLAEAAERLQLSTPVPVRVAYRSSPTMDDALTALRTGWEEAGFEVELAPITEAYFTSISAPDAAESVDVFWSNWASDWNSASTVLPPLFDAELNISDGGSGRNYGYFEDADVDAAMRSAMLIADDDDRDQAWLAIDATLRSRGAYIALAERKSMHVAGPSIINLTDHAALGGVPDLAVIGVEK